MKTFKEDKIELLHEMSINYSNYQLQYNVEEDFDFIRYENPLPEFQNQGIGTQVCRSIVEISKNQDKKALRLDAFSKNPFSVKMYQKLGFSITGTADWRKGRFYLMEKILQP